MDIKLLKCRDEDNAFPKKLYEGITVSGTLKGECNVLAPIITFGGSHAFSNIKYFNYAYIPDYDRYYFISDINLVANGLVECSMVVDVLESWKDRILQLECVVARNEFEKDPYIIDDLVIMTPTKNDVTLSCSGDKFQPITQSGYVDYVIHTASTGSSDRLLTRRVDMPFIGTGGVYYQLTTLELLKLMDSFWGKKENGSYFLESLFSNYTDKANMVISLQAYPFDLDAFNESEYDYYDYTTDGPPDNPDVYFRVYFGNEFITIGNEGAGKKIHSNIYRKYSFTKAELDGFLTKTYIDYPTISEYKIYIPYIGYFDLDYKALCGDTLNIDYSLDFTSGMLFCKVWYTDSYIDEQGNKVTTEKCVLFESAQVGINCHISGGDTGVIRDKIISTALTAAGIAASFVNPAIGMTTTALSTTITGSDKSTIRNEATGRQITAGTSSRHTTVNRTGSSTTTHKPSVVGSAVEMVSGLVSLANARIPFSINTNFSNSGIFLNNIYLTPTLIVRRPEQKYYRNYGHYVGYPLYKTKVLINCTGYTKIQDVHVDIPCTNTEREMISDALKAGVILNSTINPEPEPEIKPDVPPTPEPPSLSEPPTIFASPFIGQFRVSSPYGTRTINGVQEFHKGIDLVGIDTDRVTSIGNGVVDAVGWENPDNHSQGFGYRVRILNSDKTYTYYGHLQENSSPLVVGQSVNEFDLIGIMGDTGAVTGRHTCLSIRPITGGSIDPSIVTGIPNAIGTYKFVRS